MASHDRPRVPRSVSAWRGALSLSAVALASLTLLSHSAQAEPREKPSIEEVKEKVDRLYQEAGAATQRYNATKERADAQRERVDSLLDQVAEQTAELNDARRALGILAAAQYRSGGVSTTTTWLLSDDPQRFFSQRHVMQRMTERQQKAVTVYQRKQTATAEQRATATRSLARLSRAQSELDTSKRAVVEKLTETRELLTKLTAKEKERLAELERERQAEARRKAAERAQAEREKATERRRSGDGQVDAGSSDQAQRAIDFARGELGKPYVWGATGPDSYDCSGLTQAAWREAGVDLPRTTWEQVDAGTTVPKEDIQPGDLIFFYDDVSHVGLYIGEGEMIHAPKPGDNVRVEAVDYMPFHSAVRPG